MNKKKRKPLLITSVAPYWLYPSTVLGSATLLRRFDPPHWWEKESKMSWAEWLKQEKKRYCPPWPSGARRPNHAVAANYCCCCENIKFRLAAVSYVGLKWILRQEYTQICDYWFLGNWKETHCVHWCGYSSCLSAHVYITHHSENWTRNSRANADF